MLSNLKVHSRITEEVAEAEKEEIAAGTAKGTPASKIAGLKKKKDENEEKKRDAITLSAKLAKKKRRESDEYSDYW